MKMRLTTACLSCWLLSSVCAISAAEDLRSEAAVGLRRAVDFFHSQVATEGGYLWRYSEDLRTREGEGKATATQVWVQSPGTPSVGLALLDAHQATADPHYLEVARHAGMCLVRGQLRSGGWDYRIEFDAKRRANHAYRVESAPSKKARDVTTLDDDNTQSALRFLMRLDKALDEKDAKIHETVEYGLAALLAAQYPNGAWPQRFSAPPDPQEYPVVKANYPETWWRTFPKADYKAHYTLNDNDIPDTIITLLEASQLYGDDRYKAAAMKGGDFLLLAQMPEPQPAWAQQYNAQMQPAWARKFEPPAVTGGESQGAMRILLHLCEATGDKKYLAPIPSAVAYLRKSQLPDGRLARFYELKTNKPLYFTKDYQLTYSDADMPTHYSFKGGHSLDRIEAEYQRLAKADPKTLGVKPAAAPRPRKASKKQEAEVRRVLAAMDAQGRWVEQGRMRYWGEDDPTQRVIDSSTFIRNVRILAGYLAAGR